MQATRDNINYFLPSEPSLYTMMIHDHNHNNNNINTPTLQPHQFYGNFQNYPSQLVLPAPDHFTSPQSSCISSNSTSDEADEQSLINERKHRRMISNRESARRSRMRKQKHLDELWSQVVWLRNENHQLLDKLNNVSESHDKIAQENLQLKEEASELRQMLCDMQLHSPCHHPLSPLQDHVPLSPEEDDYLNSDSSNQSTTSSMNLQLIC